MLENYIMQVRRLVMIVSSVRKCHNRFIYVGLVISNNQYDNNYFQEIEGPCSSYSSLDIHIL